MPSFPRCGGTVRKAELTNRGLVCTLGPSVEYAHTSHIEALIRQNRHFMGDKMVVQRLTIRAASGKLKVIPVWRSLAQSGAKVVRWNACAGRGTGVDSMTIDILEIDPGRAAEISSALAPLEMSVTTLSLTVISSPASAHDANNSSEAADSL